MKAAHEILLDLMHDAANNGNGAASRKLWHAGGRLDIEYNFGLYFIHHVNHPDVVEVTTTQAITLLEQDEI